MGRYLLKISYDGTAYHGWQVQPNGITIQQVLCERLKELTKSEISVSGCSRTDAGVHAREFFCHFDCEATIPEKGYVNGLNAILPQDIRVLGCKSVADDFHARYSAKGKSYVYRFFDGDILSPFERNYVYKVQTKLNVEAMNTFCEKIVGKHDFEAFSSSKRTVEDTMRTVFFCKAERKDDIVTLTIAADGFLYNMVRIIAGTALKTSNENLSEAQIIEMISAKNRAKLGATLPASGLFLNKVFYDEVITDYGNI